MKKTNSMTNDKEGEKENTRKCPNENERKP
jgi:hypothetical protein